MTMNSSKEAYAPNSGFERDMCGLTEPGSATIPFVTLADPLPCCIVVVGQTTEQPQQESSIHR